jgi:hypothetical protein
VEFRGKKIAHIGRGQYERCRLQSEVAFETSSL